MQLKTRRGMTLIGILVAMGIIGVLVVPLAYLLNSISARYANISAKKAIFPFADEVKMAVATDMKSYFTSARPPTPCSDLRPLALPKSNPLRSGASMEVLNKNTAGTLPAVADFALYTQAVDFCRGNLPVPPVEFKIFPVDLSLAAPPRDIFNPPGADFKAYTQFDFCGRFTCPGVGANTNAAGFNKMCQYAANPAVAVLGVFRYQIVNAQDGSLFNCEDTMSGWPDGAVGQLSYFFFWSRIKPNGQATDFFVDAGIYHANKAN